VTPGTTSLSKPSIYLCIIAIARIG